MTTTTSTALLPDVYRDGGATRSRWEDDLERVRTRLEPWVSSGQDRDGTVFYFIEPTAPGPLAKMYGELMSVGYAHGWLKLNDEKE